MKSLVDTDDLWCQFSNPVNARRAITHLEITQHIVTTEVHVRRCFTSEEKRPIITKL